MMNTSISTEPQQLKIFLEHLSPYDIIDGYLEDIIDVFNKIQTKYKDKKIYVQYESRYGEYYDITIYETRMETPEEVTKRLDTSEQDKRNRYNMFCQLKKEFEPTPTQEETFFPLRYKV